MTLEIDKALELGYLVLHVFEIYHFPKTAKYDGKDPKTGLYTEYIDFFLKMKIEASGYPKRCVTDQQKADYIEEIWVREKIRLDPNNIEYNAAKRSAAKLGTVRILRPRRKINGRYRARHQ